MMGIIKENRAIFVRARELNLRAGKEIFPVPTRAELAEVLLRALGGAARTTEIADLESLRLPPLDSNKTAEILAKCPDAITVCGRKTEVEYRGAGYAPRVRVDFRGEQGREWLSLHDGGIHLPDDREVTVHAAVEGYGYYIEAPSSQFKAKARECLNQALWDRWAKPEMPAPTDAMPEIETVEYGRCVVSNDALIAYGTLNYSSWQGWKSVWYRNRAEAERAHTQACASFAEVREKTRCSELKKRIGELAGKYYYDNKFPEDLRTGLHNACYGYSGSAKTSAELEQLIARVEVAEIEVAKRDAKAEHERMKAEGHVRTNARAETGVKVQGCAMPDVEEAPQAPLSMDEKLAALRAHFGK